MPAPLPPGPGAPPTWQLLQWLFRPLEFLQACRQRYGELFTLSLLGEPPWVVLCKPEHVRELLRQEATTCDHGNAVLRPLVGSASLLTLNGAEHRRHRKLLTPPFLQSALQELWPQIRAIAGEHLQRATGAGAPTQELMRDITLEVIFRLVLGAPTGHQELRRRLVDVLALLQSPLRSGLLFVPPLRRDLGRFSPGGRFARLLQQADAALHGLISARRRSGGPPAIIDLLLAARDEEGRPLSDAELRDELITLLIAGHETTATALSWTLAWVRRDPGVQARLCDELRSAGGDDALPYTTAVCNEGLRVTPTIPVVARVPRQPVQLAGHEIAAPTALVPCILQVHRDPALYPEPERFRPERFLEQRHAAWEFFPFGGGVRRCIGAGLALLEMKAVLSALFTRHDATPIADPRPPRPRRSGVTLRPADDEPLRLRPLPGHATTASAVSAGAAAPIVAA